MALLTASALGKTIRENDIDSLYYFYGHDTAALESRRSDINDSKKRLLPHSLHNRLGGRDDNIFHGGGVKAWSVFKRSRLRFDGGSTQLMRDKVA